MPRRKPSPLQRWRAEYNYISREVRKAKANRHASWGSFKRHRHQSRVEFLRQMARDLLARRGEAAEATRKLRAEAQARWEAESAAPVGSTLATA